MKVTLHSDSDSRLQSDEDETNKLCDQYIVVKLEDDAETEHDLSIFAPVESSGSEEEEEEEEEEVSTWSRRNIRERENQDDSAFPEKKISRRISDGHHKSRKTFLAEQRQRLSVECSATDVSSSNDHSVQKDMNAHLPSEEHTFYQATPPSDSARGPAEMSGLNMAISPLVAMEPPVFPNAPVQSKSVVGEDQQNILLEVLNYCRFLHAAVQRLEQKIDLQMSNESSYKRSSARLKKASKASLPVEERQLSWSLAQHLDSPVQRNPRWVPPWKRGPDSTDLQQADNNILQTGRPPGAGRGRGRGRGRGKGRGRGRGGRGHNNRSPAFMLKPFGDETTHDLLPSQIMGSSLLNTVSKHQQKGKKGLAQVDGEKDELEKMPKNDEPTLQDAYHKVLIGSPLRKVWIPLSVYKEAFKEVEPQKAVEPVLHALFPISTLSCSAVTGNPAHGIKQLDPNKIEALREFLAEMYPQFDVSVRGVTWAQCLGVINNITKNLRKRTEKTSHLPKEVRFSATPDSSLVGDTKNDPSYS